MLSYIKNNVLNEQRESIFFDRSLYGSVARIRMRNAGHPAIGEDLFCGPDSGVGQEEGGDEWIST